MKSDIVKSLKTMSTARGKPTPAHHDLAVSGLRHCGCTDLGAASVLNILDPTGINHNPSRKPLGYPCSDGTRSNVYSVKGGIDIVNDGETVHSDIGVIFCPSQMYEPRPFSAYGDFNNHAGAIGVSRATFPNSGILPVINNLQDSLVTVWKKQSSQKFWSSDDSSAEVYNSSNSTALDFSSYMPVGRKARLVGGYLKVEDITPELYQTGTVCCWKQKAEFTLTTTSIEKTGAGPTDRVAVDLLSAPPADLNQALLLGANSWDLKEGALITLSPSGENPPTEPRGMFRGMNTNDELISGISPPYGVISTDGISVTYPAVVSVGAPSLHHEFKAFDYQGIYMSGVVPETKLRLTWQLEFEVFPQPTDRELTLATSSLPSDPRALQLMDEIFRTMPYGVPAHENALGDWFKTVASKIATLTERYAAPILGAIRVAAPELAPAASAAMAAIRLANNRARPQKQNKKKRKNK